MKEIPGTQYKIIDLSFFPMGLSFRFFPELFSQQHLKFINAQMTPKRPAGSFMLTEFLMFFLLKFIFNKFIDVPGILRANLRALFLY